MKNFFVSSQSIKGRDGGFASYASYLKMKEHPNHVNSTQAILPVKDNGVLDNIMRNTFEYEAEEGIRRAEEGIRGRYKLDSFAHSFVLSIPKENELNEHIRPTDEQWKAIFKDVAVNACKLIVAQDQNRTELVKNGDGKSILDEAGKPMRKPVPPRYGDLKPKDIWDQMFANVHVQKQGNDHLNIVVGKLVKGHVIKELTQSAIIENMKSTFTASLSKHCDLKIETYKPMNTGLSESRLKMKQIKEYKSSVKHMKKLKEISERYSESLGKSIRNYVNNVIKENGKLSEKWAQRVEELQENTFNDLHDENPENAFNFAKNMNEALELSNQAQEANNKKSVKKIENREGMKPKRDKNGSIVGWVDDK